MLNKRRLHNNTLLYYLQHYMVVNIYNVRCKYNNEEKIRRDSNKRRAYIHLDYRDMLAAAISSTKK